MSTMKYEQPEKVIIEHVQGSKASQREEFNLDTLTEIVIGRDPSVSVLYDANRETLVSRRHTRIVQSPKDPNIFTIEDLNSRNGTYVNGTKVIGAQRLYPGDQVEIGKGGPKLKFTLYPESNLYTEAAGVPETSWAPKSSASSQDDSNYAMSVGDRSGADRAAVSPREARILETKKKNRRFLTGIGVLAVLVSAVLFLLNRPEFSQLTPVPDSFATGSSELEVSEIASQTKGAVVYIEAGWKLIFTSTGQQLYHYHFNTEEHGRVPAFVRIPLSDGSVRLEPYLTTEPRRGVPIGGEHRGTGFIVSEKGHILTNRHVAASWETQYGFPEGSRRGYLVDRKGQIQMSNGQRSVVDAPKNWVPARSKQAGHILQGGFEGRNDYLYVTLATQSQRHAANLTSVSDVHDAAAIKIDLPIDLEHIKYEDNYDSIEAGEEVVVVGYPAVSPAVYGVVRSQDTFNRESRVRVIPDPTITQGIVSRVIRGYPQSESSEQLYSNIGDVYQLDINATGAGNSGGPVLNKSGEVIAIFFAGNSTITFAVPIRYGLEVLGIQ